MKKRLFAFALAAAMLAGLLSGCGAQKTEAPAAGDGVVVINYPTFQCGVNTAAPVVDQLIAEFNDREGRRPRRRQLCR